MYYGTREKSVGSGKPNFRAATKSFLFPSSLILLFARCDVHLLYSGASSSSLDCLFAIRQHLSAFYMDVSIIISKGFFLDCIEELQYIPLLDGRGADELRIYSDNIGPFVSSPVARKAALE